MYSYQTFTPGNSTNNINNTIQYLNYAANYNSLFPTSKPLLCACVTEYYDKNLVASNSVSARLSKNERISIAVNNYKGGKTQFGNFYLGQPLNINYLGRTQGMPGGSGKPPSNF